MKNLSYRVAKKSKSLGASLIKYIHLQLFLTLCSWPLLLAWGLPLSYASIIGNLIFTPFLTAFLLVSSLIFFCELLFIPNGFLIYILEWITTCWTWILACSNRSWLFSCPVPGKMILFLLPLAACLILQHKKLLSPIKNSSALLGLLIFCCLLFKTTIFMHTGVSTIECFEKEITLIQAGSLGTLIDPGALGRRVSAPSWVRYTLIPHITKRGITSLTVICARPSAMVFQALQALVDSLDITTIYLPAWSGNLKNQGWRSWERLLSSAKKYGTTIEVIKEPVTIKMGTHEFSLEPEIMVTKKNKMAYKALIIKY